jgi:hypothetical protein
VLGILPFGREAPRIGGHTVPTHAAPKQLFLVTGCGCGTDSPPVLCFIYPSWSAETLAKLSPCLKREVATPNPAGRKRGQGEGLCGASSRFPDGNMCHEPGIPDELLHLSLSTAHRIVIGSP